MKYTIKKERNPERGSATVKFMVVALVLFVIAHGAYNYIPVAYEGANFKQEMQTAVVQGMAAPANITGADMAKGRIQRALAQNNIPTDAVVQVKSANNALTAHVSYEKKVEILPFGLYQYNYKFDHTATPTGFLLRESVATQ